MTNIARRTSAARASPRAPEGGEVGPVQSGWRLALREFAENRLAVVGAGAS